MSGDERDLFSDFVRLADKVEGHMASREEKDVGVNLHWILIIYLFILFFFI